MTKPNASFAEPREPDLLTNAPSITTALPLDGLDDDMKQLGIALLDAMRAFVTMQQGNAEGSALACHVAAGQLDQAIPRITARARKVTSTIKRRS